MKPGKWKRIRKYLGKQYISVQVKCMVCRSWDVDLEWVVSDGL